MKKTISITVLFLIGLFLCTATLIAAEATAVKITKCQYDDMEEALSVEYDFVKGPKGDHVHLWIDGKEKKAVKQPKGFKLTGAKLSKGERKVELRVNDASHTEVGVSDTYKLVVK
ncbi:MAG: hypothetical protein HZA06_05695 [Nitrospirae bacterium]|nr:hypothetical protein [Nitrospirota bacterium]